MDHPGCASGRGPKPRCRTVEALEALRTPIDRWAVLNCDSHISGTRRHHPHIAAARRLPPAPTAKRAPTRLPCLPVAVSPSAAAVPSAGDPGVDPSRGFARGGFSVAHFPPDRIRNFSIIAHVSRGCCPPPPPPPPPPPYDWTSHFSRLQSSASSCVLGTCLRRRGCRRRRDSPQPPPPLPSPPRRPVGRWTTASPRWQTGCWRPQGPSRRAGRRSTWTNCRWVGGVP